MLYKEALMPKQFGMTGMQKSAEGIIVWEQAELFRHSGRKREQQTSRAVK
jgi:hypothetical protein